MAKPKGRNANGSGLHEPAQPSASRAAVRLRRAGQTVCRSLSNEPWRAGWSRSYPTFIYLALAKIILFNPLQIFVHRLKECGF